ncbi:MAG: alanine racemase [Deltaproteobacteria bacterium]|nr:alanine racemase [Deltaproteobacteria bacterium]
MEFYRPTVAEIDAQALAQNVAEVRARIPAHAGICAMVKADAYGHGAVAIATQLAAVGIAAFGVATVEEGMELRAAGIGQPILVMGGLMAQGAAAAAAIAEQGLTPVVHTPDAVPLLDAAAAARGVLLTVHLKIDTGMGRLGARPETLPKVCAAIRHATHLRLGGVMTHFAHAADPAVTQEQCAGFAEAVHALEFAGEPPPIWHLANSGAILRGIGLAVPPFATLWVRPGIMLYGAAPFPEDIGRARLRPVMHVKSRVILMKQVPAGTRVSYAGTWTAPRPSRIAVIPIGYADGYPWLCGSRGQVLIGGARYPIVGRVTMDFCMIDVTDGKAVAPGSEVVLLGTQGGAAITAEELAGWAQTIPYEILTRISKRMPRIYTNSA